jgi:hypothetical protein
MNETKSTKESKPKTPQIKEERRCGIIMPISKIGDCTQQHWKEVKGIIEDAIKAAEFTPLLVSDADDSGIIQHRIVQNIYDNEMIVCDVSCKNPNVMFELGMRLAFDKPTIIIMDNDTPYSFDTAPIEHLTYPRNLNYYDILDFKEKLTQKIKATYESYLNQTANTFLKNFGEFRVASIEHREGEINDVILSRLEYLSGQIDRINASIYNTSDSNIRVKQPKELLENYIHEFCMMENVERSDLWLLGEESPLMEKLVAFLESKSIIRRIYRNPDSLRRTLSDILAPF